MIGNLNIANSNRKDTNIKFTKDQEIAVHELIEFLAQPWDDKKYINALCSLEAWLGSPEATQGSSSQPCGNLS